MRRRCVARTFLVACLATGTVTAGAGAQAPSAGGVALAKRLMASQQVPQTLSAGMDSMFAEMGRGPDSLPTVFRDSLAGRIRAQLPNLMDSVAVVVARSMTEADLQDIVRFFESPVGRRYVTARDGYEGEVATLAQRWISVLALNVMTDLVSAGLMELPDD